MTTKVRQSQELAIAILNNPYVILDTETTGLSDTDQPIEIAMIDHEGNAFNERVKPTVPISDGAYRTHKISSTVLKDCPTLPDLLAPMLQFIGNKTVVCFNLDYDSRILHQGLYAHGIYLTPILINSKPSG